MTQFDASENNSASVRPTISHSIFRRRLWLTVGVITAVILIVLLMLVAVDVLFLLLLGILAAVLLNSLANWVNRRTALSYGWSLGLVGFAISAAFVLLFILLGQPLADQIDQLARSIPASFEELRVLLQQYSWGRQLLDQVPDSSDIGSFLASGSTGILTRATGILTNTFGVLANLFIVLFVGIYLAIEPQLYVENSLRLLPINQRPRAREVLSALYDILQRWLLARFISMTVVGVLTTIGLALIGMPLGLTLGLIAGILSFIPNLGPLLAIVPAALIAINTGPQQVIVVIALYTIVQAIESYLITPYVERRTVSLAPAATLVMQLFLSVVVGFIGLLLAAPLVAIIIVLVRMLYIEDMLGDTEGQENIAAQQ